MTYWIKFDSNLMTKSLHIYSSVLEELPSDQVK